MCSLMCWKEALFHLKFFHLSVPILQKSPKAALIVGESMIYNLLVIVCFSAMLFYPSFYPSSHASILGGRCSGYGYCSALWALMGPAMHYIVSQILLSLGCSRVDKWMLPMQPAQG